jgi:hypothetical protein
MENITDIITKTLGAKGAWKLEFGQAWFRERSIEEYRRQCRE